MLCKSMSIGKCLDIELNLLVGAFSSVGNNLSILFEELVSVLLHLQMIS